MKCFAGQCACETVTSFSETPRHQGALGVTASYKPLMLVTRVREGAIVACQLALLRFISSLRFRACEPLSVLRASGYGLSSFRSAFIGVFFRAWSYTKGFSSDGVTMRKMDASSTDEFFGSLRQGKTLADFLGTLAPLQQLSAPKRVSALFFSSFFSSSWHLPKVLILQVLAPEQAQIALFRISTLGSCQEKRKTNGGATECCLLACHWNDLNT